MVDKYSLPISVTIDGEEIRIRNECDYRICLDCIKISKDESLSDQDKSFISLNVFYEDFYKIKNYEEAIAIMVEIINGEETPKFSELNQEISDKKMPIADFNIDFPLYVAPLNAKLGYDCRRKEFTHWWTFLSAYKEIGDCYFAQVVNIRKKRYLDHRPLDKQEQRFYLENQKDVNALYKMSAEDEAFLNDEF